MAGLLNSALQPAQQAIPAAPPVASAQASPGNSSLADPILQKIESGIEAKVPAPQQRMYTSCVNAGMAAMFSAQTGARVMAKLKSSTNLPTDIATGVANIFATIYNEIGTRLPQQQRQQVFLPALLSASATLACHALDTAEKLGRLKVTAPLAAQVVHDSAMGCLAKLKIGPAQIQQASAAGRKAQTGGMPSPQQPAQQGA